MKFVGGVWNGPRNNGKILVANRIQSRPYVSKIGMETSLLVLAVAHQSTQDCPDATWSKITLVSKEQATFCLVVVILQPSIDFQGDNGTE